jgi:hypothetical protein
MSKNYLLRHYDYLIFKIKIQIGLRNHFTSLVICLSSPNLFIFKYWQHLNTLRIVIKQQIINTYNSCTKTIFYRLKFVILYYQVKLWRFTKLSVVPCGLNIFKYSVFKNTKHSKRDNYACLS